MTLLDVKRLSKAYADKLALDNLSFSIEPGEVVALLGANGSGKTTTIKSICSLIECEQGDIYFNQQKVNGTTHYLQHIGAVLEGARNVHWRLTALQNAEYFSTLRGGSWKQCRNVAESLIDLLGLGRYQALEVGKMSTGNRQKVAILCALVHQPQLLLLDEPTIGLDVGTVIQIKNFILEQVKSHAQSFLITSHDLPFIDEICERVLVLHEGKLVFDGSLDKLKKELHQYELVLDFQNTLDAGYIDRLKTSLHEENIRFDSNDQRLIVRFNDVNTGLRLTSQIERDEINVMDLEIKRISMEKAYLEVVKGGVNDVAVY
jgi:ABC-2 type transport system ATP-binding protein